jgi:hypothetical protein
VGAELGEPPALDDCDQIGARRRREPVGDDDNRPAVHQPFEGMLDHEFGTRIE